jgi:tricarballylate dehydrogenase
VGTPFLSEFEPACSDIWPGLDRLASVVVNSGRNEHSEFICSHGARAGGGVHYESDVVVVGCGIAGMAAALSAAEAGASVRVLERATRERRGGNSRYTSGNLRMKSLSEPTDDIADQLQRTSDTFVHHSVIAETLRPYDEWSPPVRAHAFADPELVRSLIEHAPEAVGWMAGNGVGLASTSNPASGVPCLETVGGGITAVEGLGAAAEAAGVEFHYETAARDLLRTDTGSVAGVYAMHHHAGAVQFQAHAVVLACGGFEGNPEMASRYLGPDAYRLRTVCPGGMYNKGEGIEMALRAGAAPAGQYGGFHAMICDPRSVHHESIKPWNYGILVNVRGRRFVDEGADARARISDDVGRAILAQPDGRAFFVFDASIEDIGNYRRQIGSEHPPITAQSPGELANALGIDATRFVETLADYSAATRPGSFTPVVPDGLATHGLALPKSNWARPISGPTLMAYPVVCTNVFTFGGLRVDGEARVLDLDGYVIDGLYAAGETSGLYYGHYASSTSYLRGLVFGRRAGLNAASQFSVAATP